ncbi:Rgg/GadR/MutR family transcriptional regulator [Streptococcus cuniculipharyngis]|uniref:Helix-turn-helix domain-containing protein n=1 Tax=Streptococcus cuniculipharyngis TaxID=1562651 RepID=A0A5C5SG49_9STRE|nr:Rgg/GadR/MutR family transcriptional regulator [Streptococcus cuniculipharyngis]TWS99113.1 helix-turn-helix domain-containing protein [Streptococcus cuniculipharyngis]
MKAEDKLNLGEFYKELRLARGIKQKEVARDGLSVSQLSKFETGQSMLSADKLLIAIEGIHMTFEEFGYALYNYQKPLFVREAEKINELFQAQDKQGLINLKEKYKQSDTCSFLNYAIVKNILYILDGSSELASGEERERVTHYLYSIEDWTNYELYVFGNTIPFLSDEDIVFLGKEFLPKVVLYGELPDMRRKVKQILINLISEFVDRDIYYYVDYFAEKLQNILTYQDIFEQILLTFLKMCADYKMSKLALAELEAYVKGLEILNNPELLTILKLRIMNLNRDKND